MQMKLGEMLVRDGRLTEPQLEAALKYQARDGARIGTIRAFGATPATPLPLPDTAATTPALSEPCTAAAVPGPSGTARTSTRRSRWSACGAESSTATRDPDPSEIGRGASTPSRSSPYWSGWIRFYSLRSI